VYIKTYRKEKSVEKQGGAHGGDLQGQEGKMAVLTHLEKGSHMMFE
jgi:hypothetical protein